jgi:transposase
MQTKVSPEQRQAAKREIVRQIEQGISAKVARMESAVPMHRVTVYRLLKRVQTEGERALTDGRHGHPVKLCGEVLTFLIEQCQANPCVSSPAVQRAMQEHFGSVPSVSQLNRVRARLGLSRRPVPQEKKTSNAPVN